MRRLSSNALTGTPEYSIIRLTYNSTRNAALQVTAAQAIAQGISEEGGLFVPQSFPKADLNDMLGLDYIGRAEYVLSRFLTDFTREEI